MLTGMIAIAGIGAVTSLFYFIGCVSANSAVQEGLGSSNDNFKDKTSPGAGGALLCLGLIFAVIATGLGVAAPPPATQQAGSSTETVEPAEPKEMQAVSP